MNIYGRDVIWDAATWAGIDEAVEEEVKRVRVARRVFRTEDVRGSDGSGPFWVSTARIGDPTADIPLRIPEGEAKPFVELSVPFWLTHAQADAEDTLHTARTLARRAAMSLAVAEDQVILRGKWAHLTPTAIATNTADLLGLADPSAKNYIEIKKENKDRSKAQALLEAVTTGIGQLAKGGWPQPYALILGAELYEASLSRLADASSETAVDRFRPWLKHFFVTSALNSERGVLASLLGDPTAIYVALDALTAYTGERLVQTGETAARAEETAQQGEEMPKQTREFVYTFRVFERFQFANRGPSSIRILGRATLSDAEKAGA